MSSPYLEQHTSAIEECFAEALNACLEAQPDDPAAYLAQHFAQRPTAAMAQPRCKGSSGGLEEWSAVGWLNSLPLAEVVGDALMQRSPPGDQLAFVRSLREPELRSLLTASTLVEHLSAELAKGTAALREAVAASGAELNAKFAAEGAGAMAYGKMAGFYEGIEQLIGPPSPNIGAAMEQDHCEAADSDLGFRSNNYDMMTCSRKEWWFVVDPPRGLELCGMAEYPQETRVGANPRNSTNEDKCRRAAGRPLSLSAFDARLEAVNAQLRERHMPPLRREELVAGRLYTGPMFMKYNLAVRAKSLKAIFGARWEEQCLGNGYVTTVHCINSAIVKMSKLTLGATLWRGYSGVGLSDALLQPDAMGFRGGVDSGFQSWTKGKEVSFQYAASGGAGMLYEVTMGLVDRGADFAWLSQYPHEQEVTYAPLTAVEILSTRVEAAVLVVEVRMNINLAALTIDEIVSKMKRSHLGLLEILKDELRLQHAPPDALARLEGLRAAADALPFEHYNEAYNYELATTKALELKGQLEADALMRKWDADEAAGRSTRTENQYFQLEMAGRGLGPVLGAPHADLAVGFHEELLQRPDSRETFQARGNAYWGEMRTTPEIEYWCAYDSEEGLKQLGLEAYPEGDAVAKGEHPPRAICTAAQLRQRVETINADLVSRGHVPISITHAQSALVYSGPLFQKLNTVMRALLACDTVAAGAEPEYILTEGLRLGLLTLEPQPDGSKQRHWRNMYRSTLHAINIAAVRLSKLVAAGSIYRGMKGRKLPRQFWEDNEVGMRGGVEPGVMSTTSDSEVAKAYGGEEGLLIEMHMGLSGRGCEVSKLGLTYLPGESEIMFPAMTALEVVRQRVEGKRLVLACNVVAPCDAGGTD